ncbi:hypothetical protein RND71_013362 [Anisodus tanguticus]|uniref:Uncharacterized protein n=1 Tax=Anisodus tanguticus TaxID=243964 RepID=A0AAE1SGH1_9SOLA|nr:hypothetical protein RND71_013362 [Anisodus tanguticus]
MAATLKLATDFNYSGEQLIRGTGRTPTHVATHERKCFSRLNDANKAKRRRSIHDITSVDAADISEPSQGQKFDKLKGPCGGQLQWPITNYVTEAFDRGMISLPGPVTNYLIEGPSVVNPEKFPLGAAVGSELNSSFLDVDEFLLSIEDLITVPAEGTSGAWRGVDTRTYPSLSLQPSIAGGGTGMYTHPFIKVRVAGRADDEAVGWIHSSRSYR